MIVVKLKNKEAVFNKEKENNNCYLLRSNTETESSQNTKEPDDNKMHI